MAYETATVAGHYNLMAAINTFLTVTLPIAERYTSLRADVGTADHEYIWQAPGLSETEQIFFGIKSYQSVASDYYNIHVATFTGYVPGNSFETQPGIQRYAVPLWNNSIPYHLVANGQRVVCVALIENVDVSFYLGKMLPNALPSQFPYPIVVSGMLPADSTERYSSVLSSFTFGFRGKHQPTGSGWLGNLALRDVNGTYITPEIAPFNALTSYNTPIYTLRNTATNQGEASGDYGLEKLNITTRSTASYSFPITNSSIIGNIYGILDGVYYVSGFNNATKNVITIDTVNYLVFRDGVKTGFRDYCALRLN